jgi:hypothetical protein
MRVAIAFVACLTAVGTLSGPAFADSKVAGLTAAESSLLFSKDAKTVVLDVNTGAVLSVVPGLPLTTTAVTVTNICSSSTWACYYSGRIPYADQGFHGSTGTATGSWPVRKGGLSGGYYAKFCWTNSTTCGPRLSPNTAWGFPSGTTATGTKVTLS